MYRIQKKNKHKGELYDVLGGVKIMYVLFCHISFSFPTETAVTDILFSYVNILLSYVIYFYIFQTYI